MTDARAEVVVVGLGAAGAAILLQLARRGVRAIGIDRFAPPHAHGSTHGDTRITRLAIGEGDAYTPLVKRSHAVWRELEAETGMELLTQNGGLVLESPSAHHPMHNRFDFLDRTIAGARTHGIEHEVIDAAQVSQRFPQFALDGDERAYYEPGAGFVRPERCVAAQLEVAQRLGAQVHVNETVTGIADHEVRTAGATYRAGTVVLAAGPWLATLVSPALSGLFTVYPQVLTWYALRADAIDHGPSAMPVYIWGAAKDGHFYGFPAVDGVASGLKAATESFEHPTTADTIRGDVAAAETDALFTALVGPRLPGLTSRCVKAVRCLYTVTPDGDFVIDWDPEREHVLLVSPCSGHGFKHSAGVGDAVARWLTSGTRPEELHPFGLDRLVSRSVSP